MNNYNKYGKKPFTIAVMHGGPGAVGEMAPVAKKLAAHWGVLEPLQTAASIDGQLTELKSVLKDNGALPIQLIGFSWGAWLSYLCSAKFPELVKKLILIGSGSFEEKFANNIQQTRLSRLNEEDRKNYNSLLAILNDPSSTTKNKAMQQLGEICIKSDAFEPIDLEIPKINLQSEMFQSVWKKASKLRRSGRLLASGKTIQCPVVAIHGDYDPPPAEGVQQPRAAILNNFRFIQLKNCGHKPWIERWAKDEFYRILHDELKKEY